jgi:hypothetical protein
MCPVFQVGQETRRYPTLENGRDRGRKGNHERRHRGGFLLNRRDRRDQVPRLGSLLRRWHILENVRIRRVEQIWDEVWE